MSSQQPQPKRTAAHAGGMSPVTFSGPAVVVRHLESLMSDALRMIRTSDALASSGIPADRLRPRAVVGKSNDKDNDNQDEQPPVLSLGDVLTAVRDGLRLGGRDLFVATEGSTEKAGKGSIVRKTGGKEEKRKVTIAELPEVRTLPPATASRSNENSHESDPDPNVVPILRHASEPVVRMSRINGPLRNVRDAARRVIEDMTKSPLERAQTLLREAIDALGDREKGNGAPSPSPSSPSPPSSSPSLPSLPDSLHALHAKLQEALEIVQKPVRELSQPSFVSSSDMDGDTRLFLMGQMAQQSPAFVQALESLTKARRAHRSLTYEQRSKSAHETALLVHTAGDDGESKLRAHLDLIDTSDFDVFNFAGTACNGRPLQTAGYAIIVGLGICEELGIDRTILGNYLAEVERRYNSQEQCPYHNAVHATDVLQTTHHLLVSSGVGDTLSPIEMLAALIAAIVHDVEHPGRNNAFQVATGSDFALNYNDQSVLENHSTTVAFRLLRNPTMDFLAPLPKADRDTFRKTVIALVLATDIGSHFAIVAELKSVFGSADEAPGDGGDASNSNSNSNSTSTSSTSSLSSPSSPSLVPLDESNTLLALKAVIKCADISNPAKKLPLYLQWVDRVMEEFWMQGDDEKRLGLPVSMFMDRETTVVSKCQLGFINFVVKPLFQLTSRFARIPDYLENIEANIQHFQSVAAKDTPAN